MKRALRAPAVLALAGLLCALVPLPLPSPLAPSPAAPPPLTDADGRWQLLEAPRNPPAVISGTRNGRQVAASRVALDAILPGPPALLLAPRQQEVAAPHWVTAADLTVSAASPRGPPAALRLHG